MSLQEELKGPPPAKLIVDHVSKWFQQKRLTVHALDDVSLEVAEGEFIVIVGPSGCGKSTLLDIIAGLEHPDKGQVMADNQPVIQPGRLPEIFEGKLPRPRDFNSIEIAQHAAQLTRALKGYVPNPTPA